MPKINTFYHKILDLIFPRDSIFADPGIESLKSKGVIELSKMYPELNCEHVWIASEYAVLKHWIHRFKYQHEAYLGSQLAEFLVQKLEVSQIDTSKFQSILFCPADPVRLRQRGYHPIGFLAEELGGCLSLQVLDVFQKTKHTKQQMSLSRVQRLQNLDGAFKIGLDADNHQKLQEAKKVLLVDDLITSGATLGHLCRLLKKNYPWIEISILVLARNEDEGK